jgi:hypothetical protein
MGREKGINTFQIACREFERRHAWSRWLTRACIGRPWLRPTIWSLFLAASAADRIGQEQAASFALSAIFNLQYWQGASDELGGPKNVWAALREPALAAAVVRRG